MSHIFKNTISNTQNIFVAHCLSVIYVVEIIMWLEDSSLFLIPFSVMLITRLETRYDIGKLYKQIHHRNHQMMTGRAGTLYCCLNKFMKMLDVLVIHLI